MPEATGDDAMSPPPIYSPEESKRVSPEQAPPRVPSVKAQVCGDQMLVSTSQNGEGTRSSPVGVIRPVSSISIPPLGLEGTTPPIDREAEMADQLDEAWLVACRNMITQSLLPAVRNIRPQQWEDLRYEQARCAQQRVLELRSTRYSLEVSLLTQHL